MKKKLTFGMLLSTLAMAIGITSCKKECKTCATYKAGTTTVTYCVGISNGDTITQADIDDLIAHGGTHPSKCN